MVTYVVLAKDRHVAVAVLQAIRSFIDAKCIVVGDRESRVLRWSPLCHGQVFVRFDGSDDELLVAAIASLHQQNPLAILIPVDCDAIRMVNRVRGRLRMPVTPITDLPTLDMFCDKWQFYQFCLRHALRVPRTTWIRDKSVLDFDTLAAELGLPFVVKPVVGDRSRGAVIIASKAKLASDLIDNNDYPHAPLLAQRYVDGKDIALSLLSLHGNMCAFAIEQRHGARIDFLRHAELEHMAVRLCSGSDYHGVMHLEARIHASSGEVSLIEANPRFWMSLTAAAWCGLNFVAASIMPPGPASGVRHLTAGSSTVRSSIVRPPAWQSVLDRVMQRRRARQLARPDAGTRVADRRNTVAQYRRAPADAEAV